MTFAIIAWAKTKITALEAEAAPTLKAEEAALLAWIHNFISDITPVLKQAADEGVMAAVMVPGNGETKAAAAFATATGYLLAKGVPVVANDLKAAIQISYKNLPNTLTSNAAAQALEAKADAVIDGAAAKASSEAAAA